MVLFKEFYIRNRDQKGEIHRYLVLFKSAQIYFHCFSFPSPEDNLPGGFQSIKNDVFSSSKTHCLGNWEVGGGTKQLHENCLMQIAFIQSNVFKHKEFRLYVHSLFFFSWRNAVVTGQILIGAKIRYKKTGRVIQTTQIQL